MDVVMAGFIGNSSHEWLNIVFILELYYTWLAAALSYISESSDIRSI